MPSFFISYHGGRKFESPEEGAANFEKWKAWVAGIGDAMINPGTPLGPAKIVSSTDVTDGAGEDRLTGYSIVEAPDIDAALKIAKDCPFLVIGTVRVAEVMTMKM